jgi:hypothetical protein
VGARVARRGRGDSLLLLVQQVLLTSGGGRPGQRRRQPVSPAYKMNETTWGQLLPE